MGRVEGKVAFVTGAARGLGRACALRLVDEGADVVVSDLDAEACKAVVEEIVGRGRRALQPRPVRAWIHRRHQDAAAG